MLRAILVTLLSMTATASLASPSFWGGRAFIPTFTYRPNPTDLVSIVDSPADLYDCRRLAEVSPTVSTTPGFAYATESMLQSTVGLGGTHLYLQKRSADWTLVRGIAYDCRPGVRHSRRVIRAKG